MVISNHIEFSDDVHERITRTSVSRNIDCGIHSAVIIVMIQFCAYVGVTMERRQLIKYQLSSIMVARNYHCNSA